MKRTPLILHLFRVYTVLVAVLVAGLAFSTFLIGRAMTAREPLAATAATLMAIVVIGAAFISARRIMRPLRQLRRTIEAFVTDPAGHPLPPSGIEEVDTLARTLSDTAARLQEQVTSMSAQNEELNAVLSGMQEGVITLDRDHRITRMNDFAARLFHEDAVAAEGRPIAAIVRSADVMALLNEVTDQAGTEREVFDPETERHLQVRAGVLRTPTGARTGLLLVINDITTLRKADVTRRDFVANVSHELRTPITSILGAIETLREGADGNGADRARFLDMAGRQASRLQAIVEDLLALASIEDGTQRDALEFTPTTLSTLLNHVVQTLGPQAAARDIRVSVACDSALHVRANAHLLERAVLNLVQNAIQYSEPGASVTLAVTRLPKTVEVAVRDTGPGIEQKHLPRLFERFYRVDKSRSRQVGGTGLGLAIVKHIALAHGGTVSVQSEVGRGSTFSITVPAEL